MPMTRWSAPGFFLAIEGPDGAGKSALAHMMARLVNLNGWTVLHTFEPTGRPLGVEALHHARAGRHEEALEAFSADRADHLRYDVKPALQAGSLVICDRYALSTAVYQGREGWRELYRQQMDRFPAPDLTLVVIADADTIAGRLRKRSEKGDARGGGKLSDPAEMLRRRGHYLAAADVLKTAVLIDNNGDLQDAFDEAMAAVAEHADVDYRKQRRWLAGL